MNIIPKRFIRIWIGSNKMPIIFNNWWNQFKEIHTGYEFITITSINKIPIPEKIQPIIKKVNSCAGISDILRIIVLYEIGGIYVDTDVMPLKSFDALIETSKEKAFLAKRSSKSFESAIIGSPKKHKGFEELINQLPEYFYKNLNKSASVQTGPAFVSSVLFGRDDVLHLPTKTFYPYNGFMAPKRNEKEIIFSNKNNFPPEMIAAHFSNHIWGGNPHK